MSCVPLLFYGIVSIDTMGNFKRSALFIMFPSLLAMFCGFCLTLTKSKVGAAFILASGWIMFLTSLFFLYKAIGSGVHGLEESESAEVHFEMRIKRKRLTWLLFILLPSFPIVYIFSAVGFLDQDMSLIAFTVCNISAKVFYVVVMLNSHSDMVKYISQAELNETRRNFLRYVMHEVRVPLNSVTTGIGVLETLDLNNEGHDTLTMMSTATLYMAETLNNILSMQKIEEGKFELVMAPFNIIDLLDTVRLTVHGMMIEKELQLELIVAKDVPRVVVGDRYRLEHILANLMSNAAKFSPSRGRILLAVSLARSVNNNTCHLEFGVTDQGPGMTDTQIRKLFKPFSQLNPHELQKGGGTGVGLSICKRIVEMHGGVINVTSVVGQGSTFYFAVPCGLSQENCSVREVKSQCVDNVISRVEEIVEDFSDNLSDPKRISLAHHRSSVRDSSYISLGNDETLFARKPSVTSARLEYPKTNVNVSQGRIVLVVDGTSLIIIAEYRNNFILMQMYRRIESCYADCFNTKAFPRTKQKTAKKPWIMFPPVSCPRMTSFSWTILCQTW